MDKKRIGIVIIIGFLIILWLFPENKELTYNVFEESSEGEIVADLHDQVTIEQFIMAPVENIVAIELNIPTFNRMELDGKTDITVLKDGLIIGNKSLNTDSIHDGEYIRIYLNEKLEDVNEKLMVRISSTSTLYKGVGMWKYTPKSGMLDCELLVNGQSIENAVLPISVICKDVSWATWKLFVFFVLLISIGIDIYYGYIKDRPYFNAALRFLH